MGYTVCSLQGDLHIFFSFGLWALLCYTAGVGAIFVGVSPSAYAISPLATTWVRQRTVAWSSWTERYPTLLPRHSASDQARFDTLAIKSAYEFTVGFKTRVTYCDKSFSKWVISVTYMVQCVSGLLH